MPSQCCYVPGCKSGYMLNYKEKKNGNEPMSLFRPPQDMLETWSKLIPRKKGKLQKDDIVCALHFKDEDIEYYYTHVIDGEVVLIQRGYPKLKPGALPCFFNNEKKVVKKPSRKRQIAYLQQEKVRMQESDGDATNCEKQANIEKNNKKRQEEADSKKEEEDIEYIMISEQQNHETELEIDEPEVDPETVSPNELRFTYENLLSDIDSVILPSTCWGVHKHPLDRYIVFSHVMLNLEKGVMKQDKALLFDGSCSPIIVFCGHVVPIPYLTKDVTCIEDVCNLLQELEELRPVCLLAEGSPNDIIPLEN